MNLAEGVALTADAAELASDGWPADVPVVCGLRTRSGSRFRVVYVPPCAAPKLVVDSYIAVTTRDALQAGRRPVHLDIVGLLCDVSLLRAHIPDESILLYLSTGAHHEVLRALRNASL